MVPGARRMPRHPRPDRARRPRRPARCDRRPGRRPGEGEPGRASAADRRPLAGGGVWRLRQDAFAKNREIEDRRNEDRFHFIDWTSSAFDERRRDSRRQRHHAPDQPGENVAGHPRRTTVSRSPTRCVGTDSHTPHVDALGVIAVGVGGLEAENVMLGRASWMRLPEIVGVELGGRRQPGITATDIVLALTEFLRKSKVVGSVSGILRRGRSLADARRPCDHFQHGARIRRDRGDVRDRRADARVPQAHRARPRAGEARRDVRAGRQGSGRTASSGAVYERVLRFDLSSVVRNVAGPSNPHAPCCDRRPRRQGHCSQWQQVPGEMPDGAVIIAAITSCTNT